MKGANHRSPCRWPGTARGCHRLGHAQPAARQAPDLLHGPVTLPDVEAELGCCAIAGPLALASEGLIGREADDLAGVVSPGTSKPARCCRSSQAPWTSKVRILGQGDGAPRDQGVVDVGDAGMSSRRASRTGTACLLYRHIPRAVGPSAKAPYCRELEKACPSRRRLINLERST
jgi:hypothetical protein